ncbi:MAG: hypothetical protein RL655_1378, partial [Pseudomonadota bacterium]
HSQRKTRPQDTHEQAATGNNNW